MALPPMRRGGVIAVVGPDASGKSTLATSLQRWLVGELETRIATPAYAPCSRRGRVARLGVRLARRLLPGLWTPPDVANARPEATRVLTAVVALVEAFERARFARALVADGARGVVVVSDRFPCALPETPTGPRIRGGGLVTRVLARLERRLYASVPQPSLVVRLDVPEDEALRRNAARREPKPEAVVRHSQRLARNVRFEAPELRLDGAAPLEESEQLARGFVRRWLDRCAEGAPTVVDRPAAGERTPRPLAEGSGAPASSA